jgi:hypothetical protein
MGLGTTETRRARIYGNEGGGVNAFVLGPTLFSHFDDLASWREPYHGLE